MCNNVQSLEYGIMDLLIDGWYFAKETGRSYLHRETETEILDDDGVHHVALTKIYPVTLSTIHIALLK